MSLATAGVVLPKVWSVPIPVVVAGQVERVAEDPNRDGGEREHARAFLEVTADYLRWSGQRDVRVHAAAKDHPADVQQVVRTLGLLVNVLGRECGVVDDVDVI